MTFLPEVFFPLLMNQPPLLQQIQVFFELLAETGGFF
jgi:hypothetical protein